MDDTLNREYHFQVVCTVRSWVRYSIPDPLFFLNWMLNKSSSSLRWLTIDENELILKEILRLILHLKKMSIDIENSLRTVEQRVFFFYQCSWSGRNPLDRSYVVIVPFCIAVSANNKCNAGLIISFWASLVKVFTSLTAPGSCRILDAVVCE